MTNMKMNTVILLSLAACTGMLACPGAWATAVCQEQSYHLKTACPHPLSWPVLRMSVFICDFRRGGPASTSARA